MVHETDELEEDNIELSEEAKIMAAARKVVQAGIWLIRNGYGQMGILPYASPSGCHWRCEFHPSGRPSKAFYRYSTGCGSKYLFQHCGGSVQSTVSPKKLAQAIMVSVPEDIEAACAGEPSVEMLRWLDELERALDQGYVPEAFHEFTEDFSRWALVSLMNLPASSMAPQPGYAPPGQEKTCLNEPYWHEADTRWQALSKSPAIMLQTATLTDDYFCFEMADRMRQALNDVDKFNAMRLLRDAIAAIHARPPVDVASPVTRPVSMTPQASTMVRRGGRLLAMVHELHKAGYQRLRICAGMSPTGKEWRCSVLPVTQVKTDGWSPAADGHQYSSNQSKQFFGWTDTESDDARTLAQKFIERFSDTVKDAAGADWAYAGWFTDLLGRVENGELPVFYQGFDLEPGNREAPMPPPPIYPSCRDSSDPTGYPLIPNTALTREHLPPEAADYEQLYPFCLSFDSYAGGLRSIDDCNYIAESIEAKGLANASIESLRVAAFIYQRTIKWQDWGPPDERLVQRIRDIVEELRMRLNS